MSSVNPANHHTHHCLTKEQSTVSYLQLAQSWAVHMMSSSEKCLLGSINSRTWLEKDLCSLTIVLAGGVSSHPMDAHFGRNTRIIHLISYNSIGKHAFWTASFQCLTKSLSLIGDLLPWVGSCIYVQNKTKELELT